MADSEALRFTDILAMAASVASYLAAPDVAPQHVLDGIDVLLGRVRLEDLGRPRSPLAPMPQSVYGGVEPGVRELVQRWFERLGHDATAELDAVKLAELAGELGALGRTSE